MFILGSAVVRRAVGTLDPAHGCRRLGHGIPHVRLSVADILHIPGCCIASAWWLHVPPSIDCCIALRPFRCSAFNPCRWRKPDYPVGCSPRACRLSAHSIVMVDNIASGLGRAGGQKMDDHLSHGACWHRPKILPGASFGERRQGMERVSWSSASAAKGWQRLDVVVGLAGNNENQHLL